MLGGEPTCICASASYSMLFTMTCDSQERSKCCRGCGEWWVSDEWGGRGAGWDVHKCAAACTHACMHARTLRRRRLFRKSDEIQKLATGV